MAEKMGILGRKLGMTRIFAGDGSAVPVTVIEAGPCPVTQVKTAEKDGYNALQIAFEAAKEKHVTKPLRGHFAKPGRAFSAPCAKSAWTARLRMKWGRPSRPNCSPPATRSR